MKAAGFSKTMVFIYQTQRASEPSWCSHISTSNPQITIYSLAYRLTIMKHYAYGYSPIKKFPVIYRTTILVTFFTKPVKMAPLWAALSPVPNLTAISVSSTGYLSLPPTSPEPSKEAQAAGVRFESRRGNLLPRLWSVGFLKPSRQNSQPFSAFFPIY
jgi:hypothetical protein